MLEGSLTGPFVISPQKPLGGANTMRHRVNHARSRRAFNGRAKRTKRLNHSNVLRGGIRL